MIEYTNCSTKQAYEVSYRGTGRICEALSC